MLNRITATVWWMLADAHAKTAASEAKKAARYLDPLYGVHRIRRAQDARVAAGFAAASAQDAMTYLNQDNYDAVVCAAEKAHHFLTQACQAAEDAAVNNEHLNQQTYNEGNKLQRQLRDRSQQGFDILLDDR